MTEEPYTNRELDAKFEGVLTQMTSHFDANVNILAGMQKDVTENLAQAKRTNGYVADLKSGQKWMQGFLACLTTVVLPALLYLAATTVTNSNKLAGVTALVHNLTK